MKKIKENEKLRIVNFGKIHETMEVPDLIAILKKSYDQFFQLETSRNKKQSTGLQAIFLESFPITDLNERGTLEFVEYKLLEPRYSPRECVEREVSYSTPLKVKIRLRNKRIGEVKEEEVFMGELPSMTDEGTFIINGVERTIVSQLHRSPGIFFDINLFPGGERQYSARIIPYWGVWIEFILETNNIMNVSLDRKRKIPVTVLLKAMGYSKEKMLKLFSNIKEVNVKQSDSDELVNRKLAEDVVDKEGNIVAKMFTLVDKELIKKIKNSGIEKIKLIGNNETDAIFANTIAKDTTLTEADAFMEIYRRFRPNEPPTADGGKNLLEGFFSNTKRYSLGKIGRYRLNKRLKMTVESDMKSLTKEDIIEAIKELIELKRTRSPGDDIDHLGNRRVIAVGELLENQFRKIMLQVSRVTKERMATVDLDTVMPRVLINIRPVIDGINEFFGTSQLSQFLDQTNPLAELTHKRRLSALGPGGLTRERAGYEVRDVHFSHYGRICPIETPEGPNIGLIVSLSTFARVNELGLLETPYRMVKDGKVKSEVEYLTADTEDDFSIAPANTQFDAKGLFINKEIPARLKDNFIMTKREEIQYMDISPKQLISISACLIPFIEHDDANRALMGSNMQRQTVPLVLPEPPIVQTGVESIVARNSGRVKIAKKDGIVKKVDAKEIVIEYGKNDKETFILDKYMRSNQSTCINQKPTVQKGEKVRKGQMISDGPCIVDGELSLGTNILVAYMSWGGYNFEDAILVNEKLVREDVFTSIHIEEFKVEVRDTKLGEEEITRDIPNISEEKLKDLDEDGIVRIGAEVKAGDILVGKITPREETRPSPEERLLRAIFGSRAKEVRDTSLRIPSGCEGKVIETRSFSRSDGDELPLGVSKLIKVYVAQKRKLAEGDKMAGRHGNKGVVSKILPEESMPFLEDGTPIGIVLNPLGVPSRMNLGQIMEVHLGLAAKALGLKAITPVFDGASEGEIRTYLKKAGLPESGKMKIIDGRTGIPFDQDVTVGYLYMMKLSHLVDDKMHARSTGPYSLVTQQPLGGKAQFGGQRFGEMEVWALEAYGAAYTLQEMLTVKSDDTIGRAKLYEAIVKGKIPPKVGIPESFNVLIRELQGLCLNISFLDKRGRLQNIEAISKVEEEDSNRSLEDFVSIRIGLSSPEIIGSWSHGEVRKPETINYRTFRPEREGLFCEKIFGPTQDWKCFCEKYEGMRYKGITCDRCGVEITESGVRRVRMGHINLVSPVSHIWYVKEIPSPISMLLDITSHEMESVLYFEKYITLEEEKESQDLEAFQSIVKKAILKLQEMRNADLNAEKFVQLMEELKKSFDDLSEDFLLNIPTEKSQKTNSQKTVNNFIEDISDSTDKAFIDVKLEDMIEEFKAWEFMATPCKKKEVINEKRYRIHLNLNDSFKADIGAKAIKGLLSEIDVKAVVKELQLEVKKSKAQKNKKLVKKLELVQNFLKSGNKPAWMILDIIPVIPPELRPMVQLESGRFATSDINDLYRRVINRNNRLSRLLDIDAPEVIVQNEKRMLQEAVDALFQNGRRGYPVIMGNRVLRSLSDLLGGKQGRFRQNLLGKRVDYSGRSVIVVGPNLKFHQCGLPKKMALELFKPFILEKLSKRDNASNSIKSAKRMIEEGTEEVWNVLAEVIKDHPIILNRAPTLYRLGIQAFEPILIESKSIQVHPMVCAGFNADFDGDQMAVHVPLSLEAQLETRLLMLSTNNLLSPASGRPIASPSQDIVLGCHYLTKENEKERGEGKYFSNIIEVIHAYYCGFVGLHAKIRLQVEGVRGEKKILGTTVGRAIFNDILPEGLRFVNKTLNKKIMSDLIYRCCKIYGNTKTAEILDEIKKLGFEFATQSGISIGILDIKIPSEKAEIVKESNEEERNTKKQHQQGLITDGERYNRIIDIWTRATNRLTDAMLENLKNENNGFNPLYLIFDSGARGREQQIRQLAAMRGLMTKPSGEIIELPITTNFREGLNVLEYFGSTHGGRKGLSDTALKTADAGYLTRRLVDVAQEEIVSEEDCGTVNGINVSALKEGGETIESLADRILGRVVLGDVIDPLTGEIVVKDNHEINEEDAQKIEKTGIEKVRIRTVLTCEAKRGVCKKCYGRDLATGKLVELGEAVGVVAAESIGEPGTQLTLRTFHIGGTAYTQAEEKDVRVKFPVEIVEIPKNLITREKDSAIIANRHGEIIVRRILGKYLIPSKAKITVFDGLWVTTGEHLAREESKTILTEVTGIVKIDEKNKIVYIMGEEYPLTVPAGAEIKVKVTDIMPANKPLAEFDPYNEPILSEISGEVEFKDIIRGETIREELNKTTGMLEREIIEHKEGRYHPMILVKGKLKTASYPIPVGAHLVVLNNKKVSAGDILVKIPHQIVKTRDITGGLPRVEELFEARHVKESAIISQIDGVIEFAPSTRGTRKIIIKGSKTEKEYLVPEGKHLRVREGDRISVGEPLTSGPIDPHDILAVKGERALQEYLVNEIQSVYRLQGVDINDKHIEIISRQMLRRVEIEDSGDTNFLSGEQIDKFRFKAENNRIIAAGGKPAKGKPILQGITKASLNSDSFIAAASFQETTHILSEAAIRGRHDELLGLKENVIIGRLIPAGTGFPKYQNKEIEKVSQAQVKVEE